MNIRKVKWHDINFMYGQDQMGIKSFIFKINNFIYVQQISRPQLLTEVHEVIATAESAYQR